MSTEGPSFGGSSSTRVRFPTALGTCLEVLLPVDMSLGHLSLGQEGDAASRDGKD